MSCGCSANFSGKKCSCGKNKGDCSCGKSNASGRRRLTRAELSDKHKSYMSFVGETKAQGFRKAPNRVDNPFLHRGDLGMHF
tara:strand:- start:2054 stop:2299 length:246 start_codon:yes stop_codon:yes gene_type:complete